MPGRSLWAASAVLLALGTTACVGLIGVRDRPAAGRMEGERARPDGIAGVSESGRLTARPNPSPPGRAAPVGLRLLDLRSARPGHLFVPPSYDPRHPAPFVMMLHGAGGDSRKAIGLFMHRAAEQGIILYAPKSAEATWDLMVGGFGVDVRSIDRALAHIFKRYAVDASRVAVEGFSDGASYALSLGMINGDLFKDIIALSPGFIAGGPAHGRPRVFIAHGTNDGVLPFESTSGRIVPSIREQGYDITFLRHRGGHSPMPRLREAFQWFARQRGSARG